MNLKIKKKIISILCAATMVTSSIGASVSAIKAYPEGYALAEPSANLKKAVDNLNITLQSSTNIIDSSINNTANLAKNCDDDEILIKIAAIMSILEHVKSQITKWDSFTIENIELISDMHYKINNLGLNKILENLKDINKLDSVNNDLHKTLEVIKEINIKLEEESQHILSLEKERLDTDLAKEINQIYTSNEQTNQKIEKIVNVLENKKFNDYKKELDVILPIIDSLYIEGDKKVGDAFEKLSEEEINNNKQLRNKLKKFVSECVIKYIDEQINMYNANDVTKPLSEYINIEKDIISDASVNVIITTTFHQKYTKSGQLLDIVNKQLNQYEGEFLDIHHDKNLIKNINKFQISNFLDNLIKENRKISKETINNQMSMSKQLLESFDTMFRQYVQRITGMKTNSEMDAGYGENNGGDIPDDELIGFQEAVDKWGINNLEKHYIRDKVIKDNLTDVLNKYKSLQNLHDELYAPLHDLADVAAGLGTEEDLKKSIDQAKEALDNFQSHVVVINNNAFAINEQQ